MNETNTDQKQKPKTSKLATASIICLLSFFGVFISLILLSLMLKRNFPDWFTRSAFDIIMLTCPFGAFILGLVALIHIWLSKGSLSGIGRAVPAMVISGALIICLLEASKTSQDVCFHDLRSLSAAIKRYVKYTGQLPRSGNWCDLIITEAGVDSKHFIHGKESGLICGESAYALNENVDGMKLSEIPEDVVLLFETTLGRTNLDRDTLREARDYFWKIHDPNDKWAVSHGKELVHKNRWNQVGGPEILTTEYHQGKGCKILFADGISRFVKTKRLDTLRWEP